MFRMLNKASFRVFDRVLAKVKLVEQIDLMREQLRHWRQSGQTVALVPTMGNLHAGHLSLVELARAHADKVVVSIFVNPLQFGPDEDFERYPRTFDADRAALEPLSVDAIFCPSVSQIYPSAALSSRVIAPEALTTILEGEKRPGHFDGVTTVVAKLFNIIQPDVAVFGQKDYQQFSVIQAMVEGLFMPIQLIRGEIIRDEEGVALSSRNQYLTPQQRKIAPQLAAVLASLEAELISGLQDIKTLCHHAQQTLLKQGFDEVDYIEVRDAKTLRSIDPMNLNSPMVILGVARLGSTRLLDNRLYFPRASEGVTR